MSTERERPKLAWEWAQKAYRLGDRQAFAHLPRNPHCDGLVLHHPIDGGCDFCARATELQAERERLDISNTGMTNRKWPCPADQARGKAQYSAWPGNRAKTDEQVQQEAQEFAEDLAKYGFIVRK